MPRKGTAKQLAFMSNLEKIEFELDDGQIAGYGLFSTVGDELHFEHLYISTGSTEIFNMAQAHLKLSHKYGLVGRNGTGKSTLLRWLNDACERLDDFQSMLIRPEEFGVDERTPVQLVLDADPVLSKLRQREQILLETSGSDAATELANIYDQLASRDNDDDRARSILKELGLTVKQIDQPTSELSGGWRVRVAMAAAIFVQPKLLFLDEPTNHLDLAGLLWLEGFVSEYEGCIVVASHDREFLRNSTTDTLHVHKNQLDHCPGDWDSFERRQSDRKKKVDRLQRNLDTKREKLQEQMDKMTSMGKQSTLDHKRLSQVSCRRKKYNRVGFEKTEDGKKWVCQSYGGYRVGSINSNSGGWSHGSRSAASVAEAPDREIQFDFPVAEPIPSSMPILRFEQVSFAHEGSKRFLLKDITCNIDQTQKIAVVGRNGQGKTTALNLVLGKLKPTRGEITGDHRLRIGSFGQWTVDQLDKSKSAMELVRSLDDSFSILDARKQLGSMGLSGETTMRPIGSLSGGQRARCAFAMMTARKPHLLVLDEPTSHLDMASIDALSVGLREYKGAVLIVSHDRRLLATVANTFWVVCEREIVVLEGNWSDLQEEIGNLIGEDYDSDE